MNSLNNNPNLIPPYSTAIRIQDFESGYNPGFESEKWAKKQLEKTVEKLSEIQKKLYATDNHAVLVVFQAMDAAGKDSTIRSVFSGIDPTGFQVHSFKSPSKNELDQDFLWRCNRALPQRGRIGVFNRSHYEEVLVCKVHPAFVLGQNIPGINQISDLTPSFWQQRYTSIKNWESHLAANGTIILKFFLNVSKEEQKRRFLSRIETQEKNWKFNFGDLKERAHWDDYMNAYSEAISATHTAQAPWYIIPADNKDYMRTMVANVILENLQRLNLSYPKVNDAALEEMLIAKKILSEE